MPIKADFFRKPLRVVSCIAWLLPAAGKRSFTALARGDRGAESKVDQGGGRFIRPGAGSGWPTSDAISLEAPVRGGILPARAKLVVMNADVRWKQRFRNFDRGVALLGEALEHGPAALSQLEQEGVIQRFEYTFELAWKTLRDYLEHGGLIVQPVTPRQVLKDAFAAKVVIDGQVWIDMLDHRNLLSHTYDFAVFEEAVEAIHARYLPAMEALRGFFNGEMQR
jgi:nucleotidyltransferase substrate binding protein (TIGR01987 family)